MLLLKNATQARTLYDATRWWFAVVPPLAGPVTMVINAPFGRFTPSKDSIFTVDGIRSWILMELASPFTFLYVFFNRPLSTASFGSAPPLSLAHPQNLLALLFLLHYTNRALVSPLRTPSRSKSHLLVPLAAIAFNLVNGGLLGAYLSSPEAAAHLAGAYARPGFWACVALWTAGLAGNVAHDEILLNLRRDKTREARGDGKQHYAVPHGLLFARVSFPNYFCEWAEWAGFALAAAPLPSVASVPALLGTLAPPWLFFAAEVWTMLPRALKGHAWYKRKFEDYPQDRKAVIPYVL